MIDFRYHLVSVVSIFLALAVGIVLGSGPLKETLSNQLTDEVTSLRASKAQLNSQLAAAGKGAVARDAFAEAVAPALLARRLTGRTVALVLLPGADAGLVRQTTASLTSAGAKIGSTVTIDPSWSDPTKADFRSTLIAQLAASAKITTPVATELLPGTVLAKGILGPAGRSGSHVEPAAAQALDGLKAGGLISYTPATVTLASSVVLVGVALDPADPTTSARLATYVDLSRALDAAGAGSVVVEQSDKSDPTVSVGVVSAIRRDAASAKVVATVDDANLVMGQVAAVLALREQYAGGSGAYGLANDATAPAPQLAGT